MMSFKTLFELLLIAHILSDFYFHTKNINIEKISNG